MNTNTIAVPYMRYSSKGQSQGNSESRQTEGFDTFVAREGLTPWNRVYFDRGESAYHGRHRDGDFGELLSDCGKKVFPKGSVVWLENMDRFSRMKTYEVLADWQKIIGNGYAIHIASIGKRFDERSSEMEMLPVIIGAILAHEESVKKSIRQTDNWKRKRAERGLSQKTGTMSAACPSWLRPEGKTYVFTEDADTYRQMFRLALDGYGCGEIKTKLGTNIDVLGVLRNRTAIGECQPYKRVGKNKRVPNGSPIQNYYPPLVDETTFARVQIALDGRRKQVGRKGVMVTNLFTDRLYGSDGEKMYVKRESRGRAVLMRRTAGKDRSCPYDEIEHVLLRFLKELRLDEDTDTSQLQALEAEATDIQNLITDIKARLATSNATSLLDVLVAKESRLIALQSDIEREKAKVPTNLSLEQTHRILHTLQTATGADLLDTRTRLKAQIARLVTRVDVQWEKVNKRRILTCTIHIRTGGKTETRTIRHEGSVRRGKLSHSVVCDDSGTTEVWRVQV